MPDRPEISRFRAMSFDCYGTLIDWEAGILATLRPWVDTFNPNLGDSEILAAFSEEEPRAQGTHPQMPYPDILRRVANALARRIGLPPSIVAREGLANSVGHWPPFPDSAEALDRLGEQFKLIVLSNVDRASITLSAQLLGVEFDAIYTAEDIGSYKPARRNFEYLLRHAGSDLGLTKGEILHVAQSLFHDHVPARALGLATCWIDRRAGRDGRGADRPPTRPVRPDFRFKTMSDLADAAAS